MLIFLVFLGCLGAVVGGIICGMAAWVVHRITQVERVPVHDHPARHHLVYEEVEFLSRYDRVSLRGWYLPADPDRRCIILLQGELGHRNSPGIGALDLGKELVKHGFSVLLYDYRGRGESGGKRGSAGDREQWGALGAIDYVNSRSIPIARIGLLGFSLGAGVAILVAAREPAIPAIVADSAFADWLTELERIVLHGVLLPRWFMYPVIWMGRLFFRTDIARVRPVQVIAAIAPRPILFIHGAQDTVIPPDETIELHRAAANPANHLWIVPGAGHVKAYRRQPDAYVKRVVDFFQGYLEVDDRLHQ